MCTNLRTFLLSGFLSALMALLVGCSNVDFSQNKGLPGKASALDVDGDGTVNEEDSDVDGDGVANEEDQDCDGDGIENDDDDTPEGEMEESDDDDETCIGNGIKVPDSAVVKCSASDEDKCVELCVDGKSKVVTFHEARGLIRSGARAGKCN